MNLLDNLDTPPRGPATIKFFELLRELAAFHPETSGVAFFPWIYILGEIVKYGIAVAVGNIIQQVSKMYSRRIVIRYIQRGGIDSFHQTLEILVDLVPLPNCFFRCR